MEAVVRQSNFAVNIATLKEVAPSKYVGTCDAVTKGTRSMSLIVEGIFFYMSPSGSWGELWFLYTKERAQPQLRASSWS